MVAPPFPKRTLSCGVVVNPPKRSSWPLPSSELLPMELFRVAVFGLPVYMLQAPEMSETVVTGDWLMRGSLYTTPA